VLGPPEVLRGDKPLALGGAKQRVVLAHLLPRPNTLVPTTEYAAAPLATSSASPARTVESVRPASADAAIPRDSARRPGMDHAQDFGAFVALHVAGAVATPDAQNHHRDPVFCNHPNW
jgi:hypothetical protein